MDDACLPNNMVTCGQGTVLVGSECLLDEPPCGDGTDVSGGQCVCVAVCGDVDSDGVCDVADPEVCDDGADNDGDGWIDCLDTDCPPCPPCPPGFDDVNGDGSSCVDWNECAGENGGQDCDPLAGCINIPGSFTCGPCASGYHDANDDGTLCIDWDECAGENGGHDCSSDADCINTPGAFTCTGASCDDGIQNGNEIGIDCGGSCTACTDLCTGAVDIDPLDCEVLEALYVATGDAIPGWTEATPPCSWLGITCGPDGRVTSVDLSNLGLSGTIPPALGNLQELEVLRLGGNRLTGTVPAALANAALLQRLELQSNLLTGLEPNVLTGLTSLAVASFGHNGFDVAAVDEVLRQIHTGRHGYQNGQLLSLAGNASPSGSSTDPAITPGVGQSNGDWSWNGTGHDPISGKAIAYDLENDVRAEGFGLWTVIISP